eukprot:11739074-Alexandrium_andersonii.AAC.1
MGPPTTRTVSPTGGASVAPSMLWTSSCLAPSAEFKIRSPTWPAFSPSSKRWPEIAGGPVGAELVWPGAEAS